MPMKIIWSDEDKAVYILYDGCAMSIKVDETEREIRIVSDRQITISPNTSRGITIPIPIIQ